MGKEKNLIQGGVGPELKDEFDNQLEDQGFGVGRAVEAMVKLWVSIPSDLQTMLVRRTTTGKGFHAIIRQIVDERISELAKGQTGKDDSIYPPGTDIRIVVMTDEDQKAYSQLQVLRNADKKLSEAEIRKQLRAIGKSLRGSRDRQTG